MDEFFHSEAGKHMEVEQAKSRRYVLCCRKHSPNKEEEDLVEQLNSTCHTNKNMSTTITPSAVLEHQLRELKKCMERFEVKTDKRLLRQRKEFLIGLEWRTAGKILDRFFFYLYIGLIGISLAVFFPRPVEPALAQSIP